MPRDSVIRFHRCVPDNLANKTSVEISQQKAAFSGQRRFSPGFSPFFLFRQSSSRLTRIAIAKLCHPFPEHKSIILHIQLLLFPFLIPKIKSFYLQVSEKPFLELYKSRVSMAVKSLTLSKENHRAV